MMEIEREQMMRELGIICMDGMLDSVGERTKQERMIGDALMKEFSNFLLQHLVGAFAAVVVPGGFDKLFKERYIADVLRKASPPLEALTIDDARALESFCKYCAILRWTTR